MVERLNRLVTQAMPHGVQAKVVNENLRVQRAMTKVAQFNSACTSAYWRCNFTIVNLQD